MGEEDTTVGITFTRVYASADGESHFEDVVVNTTRVTVAPDAPGGEMTSARPATELTFLRMDNGYARDWHPAPRRQFVLVSTGEVEVTVSDGQHRRFGPGSFFLADDTNGRGHRTRAVGPDGCVVVWVACQ
jgi:hypothetical protein